MTQANILLFGNNVVKITDFGQSRSFNYSEPCLKTTIYNRMKGTCRWLARELVEPLTSDDDDAILVCTKESDVWAFGMVLYVSNFRSDQKAFKLHRQQACTGNIDEKTTV